MISSALIQPLKPNFNCEGVETKAAACVIGFGGPGSGCSTFAIVVSSRIGNLYARRTGRVPRLQYTREVSGAELWRSRQRQVRAGHPLSEQYERIGWYPMILQTKVCATLPTIRAGILPRLVPQ